MSLRGIYDLPLSWTALILNSEKKLESGVSAQFVPSF
jgi:hypothetical protein